MKLICYNSEKGNFGDDLNFWLWPQIFGKTIWDDNSIAFLGIGSILISNYDYVNEAEKYERKVIFGTGVRTVKEVFNFDKSWDISFLRGPFSSYITCGNYNNYISDGAYFIALLPNYQKYLSRKKKYKISVVPYYQSMDQLDWTYCCEQLGWHMISPVGKDVERFIEEIADSEQVICEAMHGAIVADILRVPWKRLKFNAHLFEGEVVSEFKWTDWLYSIEQQETYPTHFEPKKLKLKYRIFPKWLRVKNRRKFIAQMKNDKNNFSLSNENRFQQIIAQLQEKKNHIISNYL